VLSDCWSSEKVRTVDAWARTGEEGRGKLRKASGSCKQAEIRRCPNGETRRGSYPVTPLGESQPGELKHLSTWRKRNQMKRFPE